MSGSLQVTSIARAREALLCTDLCTAEGEVTTGGMPVAVKWEALYSYLSFSVQSKFSKIKVGIWGVMMEHFRPNIKFRIILGYTVSLRLP